MYTLADYRALIDAALEKYTAPTGADWDGLREAMRYSLLAGGKRIRPALTMEFCRVSGGEAEAALPAACAVEMLHTYSLIHDDLPCMDNDDLRRGRPTNHRIYGECTALLAGDALQSDAFAVIFSGALPPERAARCAAILAGAAGSSGMCAGQYLDTAQGALKKTGEDGAALLHSLKTGALISAACRMGAAAAGGTEAQLSAAGEYGEALGMAFQIRDDMLDALSDEKTLGKTAGTDAREGKTTFMTLFGAEGCSERIARLTKKAENSLSIFGDTWFLKELAEKLAGRKS